MLHKLSYLHFTPRTGSQGAVYQLVARGTEWPLARGTDKAGRPSFGGRGELQRVGTAKAASAIVRPEVARVASSPSRRRIVVNVGQIVKRCLLCGGQRRLHKRRHRE